MRVFLVGGSGRLGLALARLYASVEFVALDRSVYASWSNVGAAEEIRRYFDKRGEQAVIFVASGLLDPRLPADLLDGVNYWLPKNLIDGAAAQGIKVVTFGTVMEALLTAGNPYVQSKKRLNEYVNQVAGAGMPVLHVQIHTLYGAGIPNPFMFLGQMLTAIRSNTPFRMTSGRQLREYHHVDDDARAIQWLAGSTARGVMPLSHGRPTSLKDVAEAVFAWLGKEQLLEVGVLPEPAEENYESAFEPTALPDTVRFRDALSGIVEYMNSCISQDTGLETGLQA